MKKIILLLIVIYLPLIICACNDKASTVSSENNTVIFKMPEDNTVNGYRTKTPTASVSEAEDSITLYYANKNSKKFHLKSCGSAQKISNKNLYITESRDELIEKGYIGCSRCNP